MGVAEGCAVKVASGVGVSLGGRVMVAVSVMVDEGAGDRVMVGVSVGVRVIVGVSVSVGVLVGSGVEVGVRVGRMTSVGSTSPAMRGSVTGGPIKRDTT